MHIHLSNNFERAIYACDIVFRLRSSCWVFNARVSDMRISFQLFVFFLCHLIYTEVYHANVFKANATKIKLHFNWLHTAMYHKELSVPFD